jgi:Flavin reductase like domain.
MISEVKSVYEEGDHSIIIGKIVDMEMKRNATPIIYFKKKFLSIPKGLGV